MINQTCRRKITNVSLDACHYQRSYSIERDDRPLLDPLKPIRRAISGQKNREERARKEILSSRLSQLSNPSPSQPDKIFEKNIPVRTKIPFLYSSIFSKSKSHRQLINSLQPVWWKNVVHRWILQFLAPHLDATFWSNTDIYASTSLVALAESLETRSPQRMATLMTPALYRILLDNYSEWSTFFNYRYRFHLQRRPQCLSHHLIFHFPPFDQEAMVYCSPWKGLNFTFSTPVSNFNQIQEQVQGFQDKVAKNYHIVRQCQALEMVPEKLRSSFTPHRMSLRNAVQRVQSLFPMLTSTHIFKFISYLRAIRKFSSSYFWSHAKVELQIFYQFDASHDMEIFDIRHDSKIATKLEKQPAQHLVMFQNMVHLCALDNEKLGQWKMAEIDGLAHTEKVLIHEVSKMSAMSKDEISRQNKSLSFMGLSPNQNLAKSNRDISLKIKSQTSARSNLNQEKQEVGVKGKKLESKGEKTNRH